MSIFNSGLGLLVASLTVFPAGLRGADVTARSEGQPLPARNGANFRNPVIAGAFADPSVVRVGSDFYMTHSGGGSSAPSLIIWNSRDLVNWRPIGAAIQKFAGDPWAPDLVFHKGTFYLYVTLVDRERRSGPEFMNVVLTASNPAGPWSEPIDLQAPGRIDPGHAVADDGKRYLYFNNGVVAPLSNDGLRVVGEFLTVYDGWPIPPEWVVECRCLESPKLFRRGEYFYLISAQGGTAGPTTSHMVVVARSKSALGPWENAPNNPLVRTVSPDERWHSQGHGTLVEDCSGEWWVVFHAYENGFRSLGRQTLLLPVEWTAAGWPRVPSGTRADQLLKSPTGDVITPGMTLSDDFRSSKLGPQWFWPRASTRQRFQLAGDGLLQIKAQGSSFANATQLVCKPVNHDYSIEVTMRQPNDQTEVGLVLAGAETFGLALKSQRLVANWKGRQKPVAELESETMRVRIVNRSHDVAGYFQLHNGDWQNCGWGARLDNGQVQILLYAAGPGTGVFSEFQYRGDPDHRNE